MPGDGGLSHLHAEDDLVDGVFSTIREHGDDLAPPWFDDGSEDVRGVGSSRHGS